jgi:glutamyl-tRNA synthetase
MISVGAYLFMSPEQFDRGVIDKKWKPTFATFFDTFVQTLDKMNEADDQLLKAKFEELCAAHEIKPGEVLQLLRVFISGQGSGVDLFGMMALLGASTCAQRIATALGSINK